MEQRLEEYILKIADNDKSIFEDFYNLTKSSVYGYALSILKNRSDAEEVFQEVYVNIFTKSKLYKQEEKPMAWILTITRNLALMRIRKNKFTTIELLDQYYDIKTFDETDRLLLKNLLNELSDEEREIVILHAINGFKHSEIAEFKKMNLSTVLSKYNRAIKKLQLLVKEDENERK